MLRFGSVFFTILISASALVGCGSDGGGPIFADAGTAEDSGSDAGMPPTMPLSLNATNDTLHLTVSTNPLVFRVTRGDGSVVFQSAPSALQLGTAMSGDTRYHDVTNPRPMGVTFHAVDFGVETIDDRNAWISDDVGHRVKVTAEPGDVAGTFHLRFEKDPALTDIAVIRLALAADDGGYYGLGELFEGPNARGRIVPMQFAFGAKPSGFNEHHVPVPLLVSTEGYGMFVQSREAGAFDVAKTNEQQVWATFEGGVLDTTLFVNDDPNEVVAMYSRLVGLPRLAPRWAFAPMHWRDEWDDRAQAMGDADRIRVEDNPCTTFWIDNPWQTGYNTLRFNETQFPDPAGMIQEFRRKGYVILMWSTMYLDAIDSNGTADNEAEEMFAMARDRNWLVRQGGEVYVSAAAPGPSGALLDFTQEEPIEYWVERLRPLVQMGVRAFKLDYAEDIISEFGNTRTAFQFSGGLTERQMHGVFNTLFHTPYRRALDRYAGEDGGFLFVRGSVWGGQTISDLIWPGDLDNDLREASPTEVGGLPAAIAGMQSLAASGFPTFASDTGGYRGGMPTRETILRWAEHTIFTQILQLGGDGAHHNPWLIDEEAGRIWHQLSRVHMDLVPYLRMNAIRASMTGYPPVSAAGLAFPDDVASRNDKYAYMLGPDIFVAPVITPDATTRSLHLPPGKWVRWFTGETYTGPMDVTVDAPIGRPVAFMRVGAILPMLPSDLDTLIDAEPPLVDPADRPYLRARILPAGTREITTEEGISLRVARTGTDLTLTVTPAATATALHDLRMQIDLDHADPVITSVAGVRDGEADVTQAANADDVKNGCDGVCWFRDGDTLWISARRESASTIVVH